MSIVDGYMYYWREDSQLYCGNLSYCKYGCGYILAENVISMESHPEILEAQGMIKSNWVPIQGGCPSCECILYQLQCQDTKRFYDQPIFLAPIEVNMKNSILQKANESLKWVKAG